MLAFSTYGSPINCFTAVGAAIDTQFSVAYVRKSGTGSTDEAYVWANLPTEASYTPILPVQFNLSGLENTILRQGVGIYRVTLLEQTAIGGTVQVTTQGSTRKFVALDLLVCYAGNSDARTSDIGQDSHPWRMTVSF